MLAQYLLPVYRDVHCKAALKGGAVDPDVLVVVTMAALLVRAMLRDLPTVMDLLVAPWPILAGKDPGDNACACALTRLAADFQVILEQQSAELSFNAQRALMADCLRLCTQR